MRPLGWPVAVVAPSRDPQDEAAADHFQLFPEGEPYAHREHIIIAVRDLLEADGYRFSTSTHRAARLSSSTSSISHFADS